VLRIIPVFLCLLCPLALHAKDVFEWPEDYSMTMVMRDPADSQIPAFIDKIYQHGFNVRNDIVTPKFGVKVDLFRFEGEKEGYREIEVHTDGKITEVRHPADWPRSNIFPRGGTWKLLGKDTVNGQPALKYSVISDPARVAACKYCTNKTVRHTLAWLSPDNKIPLRFQDDPVVDNEVVDFKDYSVGPQDPKLFEAPNS
jgi:hypothetical protein